MKLAYKIFRFIFTIDFVAIWIAILTLSVSISGGITFLDPEKFGEVFKILFTYSAFSFLSVYLITRLLETLFFSNFPIRFMWFIAIISGSILFTAFFQNHFSVSGSILFIGYALLALIPSATFMFIVNFAISYWQERKIDFSELSIIK